MSRRDDTTGARGSLDGVHLVTGVAGFIGFHLARELLARGATVVGVDDLNSYYDVNLKAARLALLTPHPRFVFIRGDLADDGVARDIFEQHRPSRVAHLAAQAGVRYSIDNPGAYIRSNVVAFFNVLEACRHHPVDHLVYASSSSVYGGNTKVPFEEDDRVDRPVSLYAATKRSDELLAGTYSHLYGIPASGLRFFTVYGPWGRPDMAYFGFVDSYFARQPIRVFNGGDLSHDLSRDFTYIDDIIEGVVRVLAAPPTGSEPHALFNIGNSQPVPLMTFISTLETCLGRSLGRDLAFEKRFEPLKPGDVATTFASTRRLQAAVGFHPTTPLATGLQDFTDWYVAYHELA